MNEALTVGSLFAGIGGFDLGFERCGMRTIWQVEQNEFCRAVLARHFPDARRYDDVCTVGSHNLAPVDLICGGFPCQDISLAGKGGGIDGARSGLWAEYARIIGELGPRWVVVENVSAITSRGLDRVLRDLAALGYDAEWDCIPASALGAPHRRDRFWLVAYPDGERGGPAALGVGGGGDPPVAGDDGAAGIMADPARHAEAGAETQPGAERQRAREGGQRSSAAGVADPEGQPERAGLRPSGPGGERGRRPGDGGGEGGTRDVPDPDRRSRAGGAESPGSGAWWAVEPDVGRVADGVPARVDRLSALGNALVPQIAEWIGARILAYEAAR
jgi:DNA (cytosine-5)-methyltransferase 1